MTKRRMAKYPSRRCAGVIDLDATDEQLRARGLTDEAIAELRAFGEGLRASKEEERDG